MSREPVAEPYPVPQVQVMTARDVGPAFNRRQDAPIPSQDYIPEAILVETPDPGRGLGRMVLGAIKWGMTEAVMPALYKLIPQGAQEIAHGLFTGNPYWPGGATEIPVTEHPGPEIGPPVVEAVENYPLSAEFEDMVSLHAARNGMEQDRGMDR